MEEEAAQEEKERVALGAELAEKREQFFRLQRELDEGGARVLAFGLGDATQRLGRLRRELESLTLTER
jgi:hypothetical protein